LLTIPGWSCGAGVWSRLLAAMGRASICPDFRPVRTAAGFLSQVLAVLGESPGVVVGSSMGGMLAIQAARERPASVAAIVIVGGTPRFVSEDHRLGWQSRYVTRLRRRLEEESLGSAEAGSAVASGAVATFWQSLFAAGEEAAASAFFGDRSCGSGWDGASLLAGLDYLLATDIRTSLGSLQCPVLWIHGDADRVCPPGATEHVPPPHQRLVIPGAGHLPAWTRPGETAAAIERFLATGTAAKRRGAS